MKDQESGLAVVLITISRDASVTFVRADGKESWFALDRSPFPESSELACLRLAPTVENALGTVLLAETISGADIVFELPTGSTSGQIADRLVVYLDQNQWSTLSKALDGRSQMPADERAAALRLVELAQGRKLILPASSAHYYETTKWTDDEKRHRLGLTVLQLSRGWQLRDPLQVRRDEIRSSYVYAFHGGPQPAAQGVVTLLPHTLQGPARGNHAPTPPPDIPADLAAAWATLVAAAALIAVMLDRDHIPTSPPTNWAHVNQEFSNWLDRQTLRSDQKRLSIDALLLADLQRELAEEARAAAVTPGQLDEWLRQYPTYLRALPASGLFRELLQDRHLNQGVAWHSNDLIDMMYLSTAAAYTDMVICERSMGAALKRGLQRLHLVTPVFRRLRDAVPAIERMLLEPRTAQSRRSE